MLGRLERQERLLLAGGGTERLLLAGGYTNEIFDVQASMRVAPAEEVMGRLDRQEHLLLAGGGTTYCNELRDVQAFMHTFGSCRVSVGQAGETGAPPIGWWRHSFSCTF